MWFGMKKDDLVQNGHPNLSLRLETHFLLARGTNAWKHGVCPPGLAHILPCFQAKAAPKVGKSGEFAALKLP